MGRSPLDCQYPCPPLPLSHFFWILFPLLEWEGYSYCQEHSPAHTHSVLREETGNIGGGYSGMETVSQRPEGWIIRQWNTVLIVLLCTYKWTLVTGDSSLFSLAICLVSDTKFVSLKGQPSMVMIFTALFSCFNPLPTYTPWGHSDLCSQHFSCICDLRPLVCPFPSGRSASGYLSFEAFSGYWQTLIILIIIILIISVFGVCILLTTGYL